MHFDDRVKPVAEMGFTERQARFLVTVMLHAGVCVPRQYASFACIAYGHKVGVFFEKLVRAGYATASGCLHNRAQVYRLHHHALYRAIGEPESRYRRPVSARQAIDRLMRLDAIVANPELIWLSNEDEKVAFFNLMAPSLPRERLPHIVAGKGSSARVRLFPDDLPIGVTSTGRVVFLYLSTIPVQEDFCEVLQRHSDLLRALPGWTLRLLVRRRGADGMSSLEKEARQELTAQFPPDTISELRWYLQQRRDTPDVGARSRSDESFWLAERAFATPRCQRLYRRWITDGDSTLDLVSSPALKEAVERGTGRIECRVLLPSYGHLAPHTSLFRSARRGVEGGDVSRAPSQPPSPVSLMPADHLADDRDRLMGLA